MKKLLFLSLIFLIVVSTLQGQEIKFGLKAGPNLSTVVGGLTEATNPRLGYHFGVFTEIPLSSKFSFNPELLYSSIGYVFEFSEEGRPNFENPGMQDLYFKSAQRFNYLAVPLGFRFQFNQRFNLEIGPQTSFLINSVSKLKETSNVNNKESKTSNSGDFRLDYGAILGASYNINNRISLQLRYYHGLRDLFRSEIGDFANYHRALQFSLGYFCL